jgi:hypothetical protein
MQRKHVGCTALLLPPLGVCRAAVVAKARWKFLIPSDSYEITDSE